MLNLILTAVLLTLTIAVLLVRSGRTWHRLLAAGCLLAAMALLLLATRLSPELAYELRKLVGLMLMPAGLLWLAIAVVAYRSRSRLRLVMVVIWLGYSLAGNLLVGHLLLIWLERDVAAIDAMAVPPLDAVMVLGGGVYQATHGQIGLAESGDRLLLAARLYHAGKTPLLITSGPVSRTVPPGLSYPAMTAQVWQDLGIPEQAIIKLIGPRSTTDEIRILGKLLRTRDWHRVGLLTSGSHLRRALGLCRRQGLEVVPLPANLQGRLGPYRPRHLVPQGSGFASVSTACWELLGAAAGR